MTLHDQRSICEGTPGNMTCSIASRKKRHHSRVEILSFVDPLCPECWGIEPLMKKFQLEYQDYFTLRYILTTKHDTANRCQFYHAKRIAEEWDKYARLTGMCCDSDVWFENPPSPYAIALSIKAAEFQGQTVSHRFLRRIREQIFLRKEGLNDFEELLKVAELSHLNLDEFTNDFHSCRSIKALKADRRLANELSVTELPSLVFSIPSADSESIKINGYYDYSIYVDILNDLLEQKAQAAPLPAMVDLFKKEFFLTTKEVSVIYNLSEEETLVALRKLQLQHQLKPVELKSGSYWKHID